MKKKCETHGWGLALTCNKEKIMSRSFAPSYADTHAVTEADEIARDGHVKVVIIDGVQYLSMRDIVQAADTDGI